MSAVAVTAPATRLATAVRDKPLWVRMLALAFGVWLASRAGYAVFTYFDVATMPTVAIPGCGTAAACFQHGYLGRWEKWDMGWFEAIALRGYWTGDITGFYPVYPLLEKLASLIGGTSHLDLEALAVANLAALLALWGVALVAHAELGERVPGPAMLAVAAYPFAYYLAAAYSESVFLALAVFSLYFARRGRWPAAALLAALAALTRPLGFALLLPLVWEWQRQAGLVDSVRQTRALRTVLSPRQFGRGLLAALAVPAGIGTWLGYCWWRFGQPLAPLHSEALWNRHASPPWTALRLAFQALRIDPRYSYNQAIVAADVACFGALLVITLLAARRLPFAFTLYSLGALVVSIAGVQTSVETLDPIASTGRYLSVDFPPMLAVGAWSLRYPSVGTTWLCVGLLAQAALLGSFMAWAWTG